MTKTHKLLSFLTAFIILLGLAACSPEVGSEKWCQVMKDKPKGDWSANEAADFTRHCIFPSDDK